MTKSDNLMVKEICIAIHKKYGFDPLHAIADKDYKPVMILQLVETAIEAISNKRPLPGHCMQCGGQFLDLNAHNCLPVPGEMWGKSYVSDPDYIAAQQAENARLNSIADKMSVSDRLDGVTQEKVRHILHDIFQFAAGLADDEYGNQDFQLNKVDEAMARLMPFLYPPKPESDVSKCPYCRGDGHEGQEPCNRCNGSGDAAVQPDDCRAAFEKWCLDNGYSTEGHERAYGRWEGWQAAWNARPTVRESGELEELRRFKRNTEALLYMIGEEVAFMGSDWADDAQEKGYPKECYLGSVGCLMMNDTFYYASADGEDVPYDEWPRLKEIYEEWGQDGLIAWVALRRGHDPQIPQNVTNKFKAAKAALSKLGGV